VAAIRKRSEGVWEVRVFVRRDRAGGGSAVGTLVERTTRPLAATSRVIVRQPGRGSQSSGTPERHRFSLTMTDTICALQPISLAMSSSPCVRTLGKTPLL
jgi:hypothetical protein